MVSYGYTLDHIAPERVARDRPRASTIKPYPRVICAAVILGASAGLWVMLYEAVTRVIL